MWFGFGFRLGLGLEHAVARRRRLRWLAARRRRERLGVGEVDGLGAAPPAVEHEAQLERAELRRLRQVQQHVQRRLSLQRASRRADAHLVRVRVRVTVTVTVTVTLRSG